MRTRTLTMRTTTPMIHQRQHLKHGHVARAAVDADADVAAVDEAASLPSTSTRRLLAPRAKT